MAHKTPDPKPQQQQGGTDNKAVAAALREAADALDTKAPADAQAGLRDTLKTLLELIVRIGPTVLERL